MHQGGSGNVPIPKQERNAFQPRGQIAQPSSTASVIEAVDQVQTVGTDKTHTGLSWCGELLTR